MSFSSSAKSDICALPFRKEHCMRAELAGVLYTSATLSLGSGGPKLFLSSKTGAVARRVFSLVKQLYGISCELTVKEDQLQKSKTYISQISGRSDVMKILRDCALVIGTGFECNHTRFERLTQKSCCKTAFLRGAFLGSGSVSDPKKNYHLEFVLNLKELAYCVLNILNAFNLSAKISERKNSYIVYLKEIEKIITLLTMVGAHTSTLEIENIRIYKSTRNNVNRQLNCDQANMNKMLAAAYVQIDNIRYIAETTGFSSLPPSLREAAELRLAYPEASLSELAEAMGGGVTKSGMNHRLRKLNQIAQHLRESKEVF